MPVAAFSEYSLISVGLGTARRAVGCQAVGETLALGHNWRVYNKLVWWVEQLRVEPDEDDSRQRWCAEARRDDGVVAGAAELAGVERCDSYGE
jgi:hypothetical protein